MRTLKNRKRYNSHPHFTSIPLCNALRCIKPLISSMSLLLPTQFCSARLRLSHRAFSSFQSSSGTWIRQIPNALTLSRLGMAPCIAYCVLAKQTDLALAGFVFSGVTDFLDGYLARRLKAQSVLGSMLDPLADKVLVGTMFATFGIAGQSPPWLISLVLGRDAVLILGALIMRYKSIPQVSWEKFLDFKSIQTHEITPSTISKVNTALQFLYITAVMTNASAVGFPLESHLDTFAYVVASTTLLSGADYILLSRSGLSKLK